MRRLLTWAVVSLGIAELLRRLKRRIDEPGEAPAEAPAEAVETPADDPADELRRKLAESRADEEVAEPPVSADTVEERRAGVHEQGNAAVEEMRKAEGA